MKFTEIRNYYTEIQRENHRDSFLFHRDISEKLRVFKHRDKKKLQVRYEIQPAVSIKISLSIYFDS